jgi:aerobic-type carbon monoxide dehydrogenase small subunit (CoxS/CutS family)
MPVPSIPVRLTVNSVEREATVPPRLLLSDFLRHDLSLTGTHVGCEHGVCGACTILLDGQAVRACLMFAVQADGSEVRTVESLTRSDDSLTPIPAAFRDEHGLQCGFCTPGIMMSLAGLADEPGVDRGAIVDVLAGHLCRCTGYRNIVRAAELGLGLAVATAADGEP